MVHVLKGYKNKLKELLVRYPYPIPTYVKMALLPTCKIQIPAKVFLRLSLAPIRLVLLPVFVYLN